MPGYITESEAKFMSIKDSAKDKFRESIDLYHEFVPSEKPTQEQPATEAPTAEVPKQEPTAGESEPKQESPES